MGLAYLKLCDLCETPLEGKMKGEVRKEKAFNGLVLEIGYSIGGWGNRRDHIKFSGEVCVTCYDYMMRGVEDVQRRMAECRRGNYGAPSPDARMKLTS